MLKIDRKTQSLSSLEAPTLADVSITERYDLQEFISNSPDAFFKEIGQTLFLIGKEIEPSNRIQDRIDLLAVDKEGSSVVIELKRRNHKLHLLQAISYAGLVSQWNSDDILELLGDQQQEELEAFLDVSLDDLNRQQKVILVAEAFDYALLVGAEWLSDQYGVDITCCRIAVATDAKTESEYLVCSNIFPIPELAHVAAPRGRRWPRENRIKWPDWGTALSGVENAALVSYFERELSVGRESNLHARALHFRLQNKRRWNVEARQNNAYVWQEGRFDSDIAFWQDKLSTDNNVQAVKRNLALRFYLTSEDDFRSFHEAATETLLATEWLEAPLDEEMA